MLCGVHAAAAGTRFVLRAHLRTLHLSSCAPLPLMITPEVSPRKLGLSLGKTSQTPRRCSWTRTTHAECASKQDWFELIVDMCMALSLFAPALLKEDHALDESALPACCLLSW